MRKRVLVISVAVVLIALGGYGIFTVLGSNMAEDIKTEYGKVKPVDLSGVEDGVYAGGFDDFLTAVDLAVTVKNHRIDEISIKDQRCGEGYDARDVVNRIIETQSPKVDAVSGATSSSKVIMIAVHRALED